MPKESVTPQVAAQIILNRYQMRGSFLAWCRHCGYEPARHHRLLIDKLEQVVQGRTRRLAIFMPPGSAKSTYGSILFPPYYLARFPYKSLIAASHTVELAEKWGRRIRNIISEYGSMLGIELSADSQAAGRWSLVTGGEYYAAGVTTGIAGFRADGALIDDPLRSREDASSDTIRERIWEWYKSDLRTRLKPEGWIILIQTRWHEDDLAGRILEEMKIGGEQWEVISLPAQAEIDDPLGRKPGEWLWDDAYGYGNFLRAEKQSQLPQDWSALFQQNPTPDQGIFFSADWLRPYHEAPARETMNIYGASDYAVTSDGGDYTVHGVVGVDPEERLYLLDLWRGRTSSDIWIEAQCDLMEQYRPVGWAEETGQIRAGIGPFLHKRMLERRINVVRASFPTTGDKAKRAQSIRGRMAMRGLYVPSHAPWYPDFRQELLSFPAGRHDDAVDMLGLLGQVIDRMIPGKPIKLTEPHKILSTNPDQCTVTLSDLWSAHERRGKRTASRIR
jgi:predicted phage terminase large subunit-like protein